MFSESEVNNILDILEETYPEAACALTHGEVFELLVAVILSAQTTDKSVNIVTPALFEKYPDAQSMAGADEHELSAIIRSIGMYRTKTRHLIDMSRRLAEEYDGRVPDKYEELIKLPGVGRKTANVVLSVGYGQQRIAVDTHVFRVANRIGLVEEKDVLKTELALMETIPETRWSRTHHSLIFHGRNCCEARKPKCGVCCIAGYCKYAGLSGKPVLSCETD